MDVFSFFFILGLIAIAIGGIAFSSGRKEGETKGKEDGKKAAEEAAKRKAVEDALKKVQGFELLSADEQKAMIDKLFKAKPPKAPEDTKKAVAGETTDISFLLFAGILVFLIWLILF